jgi:nitrate/nitrite transporter NarK
MNIMGKHISVIAILTAFFVLLLFSPVSVDAQFGFQPQQVPEKSHQAVLSTAQGRFAFGQVSDSSDDKFMLDTFTGRLWRLSKRTDIGLCLTAVPYRSEDGECSPLPDNIPVSPGKASKEK